LISIQSAMLVALGFLAASLIGLLVLSAFWSRAVRLTTTRIKQSMPVSEAEIKAERDKLRAEYAIKVHKLETQLEQAKLSTARQLIEINRRDASISTLETDLIQLKVDVEENQNARRVLEQTVADRLPKVEARLAEAKRLLFNRDREIAELTAGAKRQKLALEEASSINAQQNAEISRLTTTVATRGGRARQSAAGGDARQDGEVALQAEIEALRTKTRDQAALIDRLQRRLGPNYASAASAGNSSSLSEDMDRARSDLSEAEAALNAVRGGAAAEAEQMRGGQERELRSLRAKIDDQTGEIARLKAALEVFEQRETADGAKPSKTALRARLGSAQAQADQQAGTISQLRVELAAANERLARQAAHFMKEMRRLGGGAQPTTGRRAARGAERHAYPERTVTVAPQASADQGRTAESAPSEARAGNGRNGKTGDAGGANRAGAAAAQMPNGPGIPDERRKPRLLDRLTGIAKS
jgi:chromosome segregation ATPase